MTGSTAGLLGWAYPNKRIAEQKYMFKLDCALLSSAMLGYFIKNLNAKNMSTAFLNGMSEHYKMDKNEFNVMQAHFFIGYLIGGFPSKYLLTKFRVKYYLGFLELAWSVSTLLMCLCTTIQQVYYLRFLVGFLEAGFFPSMVYIIGTFYDSQETNKRQALFNISGTIGTMITGALQQLILQQGWTLNGKVEHFQMLFLLDALVSIPIAFYTFIMSPGLPDKDNLDACWYFNDSDKQIAVERLHAKPSVSNYGKIKSHASFRNYFNSWHWVVFPLLFAAIRNASYAAETIVVSSWIKYDLKLPSQYYNYFPSITSGVSILITLAVSVLNDRSHGKLSAKLMYAFFSVYIVASLLLVHWYIPEWLHWTCYVAFGILEFASPVMLSWLNRTLAAHDHKRHFLVVLTNSFDYLIYAIYPVWAWDTREKPIFRKGFLCTVAWSVSGILLTWAGTLLIKRDAKKIEPTEEDEESSLLHQAEGQDLLNN